MRFFLTENPTILTKKTACDTFFVPQALKKTANYISIWYYITI